MRNSKLTAFYSLLFILCFSQGNAFAANTTDVITKSEASAILQELKNIRVILERVEKKGFGNQRKARAMSASISTINRPSMGDVSAPVTIVEVSDYQCPYCKRFYVNTFHKLKRDYVDTGKVRLVFKDLPLDFHKNARKAAQAAHCAGDQGKYWDMHNKLFASNKKLVAKSFTEHAAQLGLNAQSFSECITSDRHMKEIDKDISDAGKATLTGTPSFIIGKTTKDKITGDIVRGAQSFSNMKIVLDKVLKKYAGSGLP